ncbi:MULTISPECIES: CHAP domain-containing protein [Actinomadura]|uniref:CHAP domain-containing protein n=1 Tax=Actinomadura yumaensis TaxID=111807 RepID=A0ABW2CL38_9ACTN|nr:CHAP domain-containing protein [Actinomadura sp. J1-007]MWK40340.1 CHAP domain-containing protein [Actinomadura sp. J1-007]
MPVLKSFNPLSSEERAIGIGVGAVLAGTLGFALINPFSANAETPALAAEAAKAPASAGKAAGKDASAKEKGGEKLSRLAEARKEGYAVVPHRVKPSAVVKLAEEQVGTKEGKGGQTKYHRWYVSTPNAERTARRDGGSVSEYNGAEWCNMFVSWVGAQLGVKDMGWDAYTVEHAKWLERNGRWGHTARPGAVVFFDWQNGSRGGIDDIDHVGLVAKDNGDGTISTVEGNTDNQVQRKVRDKSQVVGYGYPDYAK